MASRRTWIFVAALAGLVALVAVAARGHSPTGGGGTHGVDSKLIFEFVLLAFVALFIICLPIAVWTIYSTRTDDPMRATKRRQRSLMRVSLYLLLLLLLSIGLYIKTHGGHHGNALHLNNPTGKLGKHPAQKLGKQYPFDWAPAIAIVAIAVVASIVVAYLLFRNPRRRPPTRAEIAAELSSVLDDSLDDLRAELDPRRAVIATYARLERTLAGFGFPRSAAEAPREYLARILRDFLEASADAVSKLTALFERAKFSTHEIDPGMKNDAIDALVEVRDELRAAVP
jgi:Domain of unknown function (DUF4129)